MRKLVVLVGVPGSGKTTHVKKLLENYKNMRLNVIHVSTDAIRGELYGDESLQINHGKIFGTANNRTKDHLQNDSSVVIFDATSINVKDRRSILDLVKYNPSVEVEAVFLNTSGEVAIQRDLARDRHVPSDIILLKERSLVIPTFVESRFNKISVVNDEVAEFDFLNELALGDFRTNPVRTFETLTSTRNACWKYVPEFYPCIGFTQDNPHHSNTVDEHIFKVVDFIAKFAKEDLTSEEYEMYADTLIVAAFLHDIGKAYRGIKQRFAMPKTTIERNGKTLAAKKKYEVSNFNDTNLVINGEVFDRNDFNFDGVAHFYNHENISAQMALRILTRWGFSKDQMLDIATIVQYHMALPWDFNNQKAMDEAEQKFGDKFFKLLKIHRKADAAGH